MKIAISTEDASDEDIRYYTEMAQAKPRRAKLSPGQCAYCDRERDNAFHPPHDASHRCESGKHNHCTCDTCF